MTVAGQAVRYLTSAGVLTPGVVHAYVNQIVKRGMVPATRPGASE